MNKLEEMAKDVNQGDLVRIFLERSDYIGYKWDLDISKIKKQVLLFEDSDMLFCGLNPYGITRLKGETVYGEKQNVIINEDNLTILDKIQFVGVNLKNQHLRNEKIKGYEIIQRTEYKE